MDNDATLKQDIKQMMVGAKEEAQKITEEAKKKAERQLAELKDEEKKKEEELKETEKRLIKKDELLDARQAEMNKEVENIKLKIEEIKRGRTWQGQLLNLKAKNIKSNCKTMKNFVGKLVLILSMESNVYFLASKALILGKKIMYSHISVCKLAMKPNVAF